MQRVENDCTLRKKTSLIAKFGWMVVFTILFFPAEALAADLLYPVPAGGDTTPPGCVPQWIWSDGRCWYVIGTAPPVFRLPGDGDNASIVIGSTFFTLDVNTANLSSLNVSGIPLLNVTFLQPGSTLTAASESVTGFVAYNHTGGTNNAGVLTLSGTYNLQGASAKLAATSESIGELDFGQLGLSPGTFIQGDGINSVIDRLTLGTLTGSGRYNLNGGQLSATDEFIGGIGTDTLFLPSTLNQTGGRNTITGELSVGDNAGSGEYDLRGAAVLEAGSEILGNGSSSYEFNQTGGRNVVAGNLSSAMGSVGGYDLSGDNALLTVAGDENLGGRIQFVQKGGRNEVAGNLNLGSPGVYELDGGSLSVGGSEVIAPVNGQFRQTGGTNTANRLVVQGSYRLEPAGALSIATDEVIDSRAVFFQNGGTHSVGGTLTLKDHAFYTLDDGTLTATEIINACPGLFCSLEPPEGGIFEYIGGSLTGNFTNETGAQLRISGSGTRVVNGTLTNSGTVEVTAQQVDFSNVILPSGVFKVDPSKVRFHNLDVAAPAYITGAAGDVFVITGDFRNFSTQNTLWNTGTSELDFAGGGTHIFDLAGQHGAGFSNNFAWGTLGIDPSNILALGTGSGDALYVDILHGLAITGTTVTNVDGAPGLFVYYNAADNPLLQGDYTLTGGGELIAANIGSAVPEPSTLLLFVSGLGSLLAYRRKRGNRPASIAN